ncbi:hypothetical protein HBH92_125790 [Parastagonospora nodorum]|nr:hypothetical protein HBH93_229300 [Parastagonospora nodorum]KAH4410908.1 hypothetical protein HBH92_125790 [Parastagonospora nodorum]KAH4442947.1 hypothetical protein HBH91_167870 [Parastagonospora nodorum]KAH4487283.1 hypothetical protein HBH89_203100 [Parastagonospora nodorum]KAH4541880.1 hypothetical protein HBH85_120560 [Parastagonospora nodorum]
MQPRNLMDGLAANKLPCSAPIADHRYLFDARWLSKLLKEILLIAIRICHCVTPCYLVCKHSCLLAHRSLIYMRIVPGDRVT